MGLFLMFFGLASFYWVIAPRFALRKGRTSKRVIGGGIGGMIVGFLSGSFLAIIIANAVATRHTVNISAGGMLAIFVTPGLVLLALSVYTLSRTFL